MESVVISQFSFLTFFVLFFFNHIRGLPIFTLFKVPTLTLLVFFIVLFAVYQRLPSFLSLSTFKKIVNLTTFVQNFYKIQSIFIKP